MFIVSADGDGQQWKVLQNQNQKIAQTTMSALDDCEYQTADSAQKLLIYDNLINNIHCEP